MANLLHFPSSFKCRKTLYGIILFISAVGPVTYLSAEERDKFPRAIGSLSVHGGGDCAELSITGIRNISLHD